MCEHEKRGSELHDAHDLDWRHAGGHHGTGAAAAGAGAGLRSGLLAHLRHHWRNWRYCLVILSALSILRQILS